MSVIKPTDPEFNNYANAEPVRGTRTGVIFVDGVEVAQTCQCPHCGGHFIPVRGNVRVFCRECMASLCDNPACLEHLHWERKLEIAEQAAAKARW